MKRISRGAEGLDTTDSDLQLASKKRVVTCR